PSASAPEREAAGEALSGSSMSAGRCLSGPRFDRHLSRAPTTVPANPGKEVNPSVQKEIGLGGEVGDGSPDLDHRGRWHEAALRLDSAAAPRLRPTAAPTA